MTSGLSVRCWQRPLCRRTRASCSPSTTASPAEYLGLSGSRPENTVQRQRTSLGKCIRKRRIFFLCRVFSIGNVSQNHISCRVSRRTSPDLSAPFVRKLYLIRIFPFSHTRHSSLEVSGMLAYCHGYYKSLLEMSVLSSGKGSVLGPFPDIASNCIWGK